MKQLKAALQARQKAEQAARKAAREHAKSLEAAREVESQTIIPDNTEK
jgi:hypothetical protein